MTEMLTCPICKGELSFNAGGRSLVCSAGHCFDISSSGYVNLTRGSSVNLSGDSKDMIRARRNFLAAGYYLPIAEGVSDALLKFSPKRIVDAGCGEGYYTAHFARTLPDSRVIGFDLSKAGVELAAKAARREGLEDRLSYAVCGIFDLPISDGSVSAVTNLFAPCAGEEFYRILEEDGRLITVVAGVRHLFGLKAAIYDDPYENEERRDVIDGFLLEEVKEVRTVINVKKEDIFPLFTMNPYYFRTGEQDKNKLLSLDSLETEVAADILIYRKV